MFRPGFPILMCALIFLTSSPAFSAVAPTGEFLKRDLTAPAVEPQEELSGRLAESNRRFVAEMNRAVSRVVAEFRARESNREIASPESED